MERTIVWPSQWGNEGLLDGGHRHRGGRERGRRKGTQEASYSSNPEIKVVRMLGKQEGTLGNVPMVGKNQQHRKTGLKGGQTSR